ncbi:type I restriction endonuclease subunit R [Fluviispira vulneris]|uniref:type I restriction endonuclease subunit R n=1 Tax=Fluviispira vulneris TaxID=2763012 RepID=UPI0016451C38|nr:type I restriction endonuclease subunit R [Fluviispira vulneris]
MTLITEDTLEKEAKVWFEEIGYETVFGPDIAPEAQYEERSTYSDVILVNRIRSAIERINPGLSSDALEETLRQVCLFDITNPILQNKHCHKFLTDGVDIQYQSNNGTKSDNIKLIDFDNLENNEFLVINQMTIIENKNNRRPDILVYVNGLPLALIELKTIADTKTDIWEAYNQIQTYKKEIPSIFNYTALNVISDGLYTKVGSFTADRERYQVWRTIDSEELAPNSMLSLEVLIKGLFAKERFIDFIKHFVAFEAKDDKTIKIIAGYHQFNAVRNTIQKTITAIKNDKRIGTVWHSTGSGKSFSMVFYAGYAAQKKELENPTIIVLTDRNDLDDQLFGQFSRCIQILRQTPVQIESRKELQEKLIVASGGIFFTTIQKFMPESKGDDFPLLSERKNIIVIADEAHRSQYDFLDGFARNMRAALPNASFVGFTGTPIAKTDADTRAVFGDYISIYDIERSIADGATVPLYYESRLIRLSRDTQVNLDEEMEELTEAEDTTEAQKRRSKWASLETLVGVQSRLAEVAKDFVDHFETRQVSINGKAMIVCMSRRICVSLYNEIIKLRPDWHSDEDDKGTIKVIMTGSASDLEEWQKHVRSKARREEMANIVKDNSSSVKIVIVRDMWLTGFDAPSMHTMYIDKPMHGHGLMQAIARVNRVFKDKPGGVVVDYIGIADALKKTMHTYTESGGSGRPTLNKEDAVAIMIEKYEICLGIMHGFSYQKSLKNPSEALKIIPSALEHILVQDDGKKRFTNAVYQLSKAFALAVPDKVTEEIRDELVFFQNLNAALNKTEPGSVLKIEEKELAIRQLLSKSVFSDGVIDIFSAAGLKKPNISILSDDFLAEVRGLPQRNLAIELLERLIRDQVKTKLRRNKVQERQFSEMLDNSLQKYRNRAIETAKVIEDLIDMAKDIRKAHQRGENLGLNEDEMAFYDALEINDSAVKVLGDNILKHIATELVKIIKENLDTDWAVKETSRAKVRMAIKRLLKLHGYPPDLSEQATHLILEQAEHLCKEWEV